MNRLLAPALLSLVPLLTAAPASAHNNVELDVAVGYRLPFGAEIGHRDTGEGDLGEGALKFDGGLIISGMAGYRVQPDAFIFIAYTRGLHDVEFSGADGGLGFDFTGKRTVEYFQFGGKVEATRGMLVPYLGFSVGLGRVAPIGGGTERFFFAPVLEPGLKIDLHKHVHLRLLGRAPLLFATKEVVCVDVGCAYAEEMKPIPQLELLGGVGVSF